MLEFFGVRHGDFDERRRARLSVESWIISRSTARRSAVQNMRQFLRPSPRARRPYGLACAGVAMLAPGLLAGCAALESNRWTNIFLPYRIEVVQGNVVTREQVARVTPGLSRAQVRDILGSPLVTDIFHANRWDYVFILNRPGTPVQNRAVVVIFEGDKLARIDAPELPTDGEFIDSIDPHRSRREVPVLALSEDEIKTLRVPARPAPAASAPEGALRNYPPLEPDG
jgi:outer membrane protein assembly factor BamE